MPTPPDLAFHRVDTRDASGAGVFSTAGRSFEGQCARKDDANRQDIEDARMRKTGRGAKD